jgi:hypothetical protein
MNGCKNLNFILNFSSYKIYSLWERDNICENLNQHVVEWTCLGIAGVWQQAMLTMPPYHLFFLEGREPRIINRLTDYSLFVGCEWKMSRHINFKCSCSSVISFGMCTFLQPIFSVNKYEREPFSNLFNIKFPKNKWSL